MAFFDFTGVNGDALPDFFAEDAGTAEIQSNKLQLTGALPAANRWAISYSSEVTSRQSVTIASSQGSKTAFWYLRYTDVSNFIAASLNFSSNKVSFIRISGGSYSSLQEADFTLNTNESYVCVSNNTDNNLTLSINGTDLLDFDTADFNSATRSALGGNGNGVSFDDLDSGVVIGSLPTLTVSGNPVTTIYIGESLPVFTATASDPEDGDLTANIVETGAADNTEAGSYDLTWEVTDSDNNTVSEARTIVVETRDVIELLDREHYDTTVGRPFVLPKARVLRADGTSTLIDPTGSFDYNSEGNYTLSFDYGNALQKTVTITVHPVPNITDTGVYSMVQKFGPENITVNGYSLKRYTAASNEEGVFGPVAFGYGFENDTVVSADSIVLASSSSLSDPSSERVKVANIAIPFDSLAQCEKTKISAKVTFDGNLTNGTLQVGFGDYRNDEAKCVIKNISGNEAELEFLVWPKHDSTIRLTEAGMGKDPDRFMVTTGQMHEFGLSSNTNIPIFVRFGDVSNTISVTSVSASALVGKTLLGEGGKLLRGKDSFQLKPFREDSVYNLDTYSDEVLPTYNSIVDPTDAGASNFSTTQGSDWISVFDASSVEVGQLCVISRNYHPTTSYNAIKIMREVLSSDTNDVIGVAQYVEEVDLTGNRIRISRPALQTYDSASDGIDSIGTIKCLTTLHPEIASIIIGDEKYSWDVSPINGVDKIDTQAIDYGAECRIYVSNEYDPEITVVVERDTGAHGFILPQNNFIYPFSGENLNSTNYGERVESFEFKTNAPDSFDGIPSPARNSDRNNVFMSPDGRHATHLYMVDAEPQGMTGVFGFNRMSCHDLSQWPVKQLEFRDDRRDGLTNSPRASGLPANAVIRKEELDKVYVSGYDEASVDADLDRAESAINHMVACYMAGCQLQSHTYLTDVSDTSSDAFYYMHKMYSQGIGDVVNEGTGYQVGDTIDLTCPNRTDSHTPTVYTVQAVNANGGVTKAMVTRTGQHKIDPSSSNQTQYETSGTGTGATFNTSDMFETDNLIGEGNVTVYPAGIADSGYRASYAGSVPMGAMVGIDPRVDLRAEWKRGILQSISDSGGIARNWSYELYAILCAIKKYKMMVCDITHGAFSAFIIDARCTEDQKLRIWNHPTYQYSNIKKIRPLLTPVLNYTSTQHLDSEGLKPKINLIGDTNVDVPVDWEDPGVDVFSQLHGYDTVYSSDSIDRGSSFPQTLSYQYTDESGNVSDIVQRVVTLSDSATANQPPTANAGADRTPALVAQMVGKNGASMWEYDSADSPSDVRQNGYFTDGVALGMKVGDVVTQIDTVGATVHHMYTVKSLNSDGSVNLSDGTAIN